MMKSQESAKRYRYAVLNYGERFEDGYGFESKLDEDEVEDLVRAAAEHIDSESFWWADSGKGEMVIEVFKEDGLSLGVFGVYKKRIIHFSIYPKNKSVDSTNQTERSHG
ncbi:Uncharacterized protein MCB1EB_1528 [Mycoavidus cysteinexigens]|uniref:Uncharacterized protein n=1 Tax=Mycoavidus cysteinexigens TaxID=1553431 RepID=A0A2Z6EW70_9BURK|nr:hypothetical protein [Mycoavidus cysteinexigens]BBE09689.1 Uncharacterized protein MCB1EB_1528 [Mycoavidus cysteinexigens]